MPSETTPTPGAGNQPQNSPSPPSLPVTPGHLDEELGDLEAHSAGTALCLSGGGYRAMVFHLGTLIRVNELGMLRGLSRVSSVSGGSITAGVLGLGWKDLRFDAADRATNLDEIVIRPVWDMAGRTIDKPSVIRGVLTPRRTVSDAVAASYRKHLFGRATLASLPSDVDGPRFVINATSVQTGRLFRFSRPFQGDYSIGLWRNPTTRLADAVACSSAFPPVLSPHRLRPSGRFDSSTAGTIDDPDILGSHWLTDGGVYDNLGLETAWKACERLFVSDGGGGFSIDPTPHRNWVQHGVRAASIINDQVRSLRKRQLVESFEHGVRSGAYFGIRSDTESFAPTRPMAFSPEGSTLPKDVPTALSALSDATRRDLVNSGYVLSDVALRRWVTPDAEIPTELPFPQRSGATP